MIKLFGKPIRTNKAYVDKKSNDVGANLFVGNLDPELDEKLLYDTFSAFGVVIQTPKIMRDPDTGTARGSGFLAYAPSEPSDPPTGARTVRFLCNRPIPLPSPLPLFPTYPCQRKEKLSLRCRRSH